MTITMDENGTLSLYCGDSGEVIVSGLDTTQDYVVYFAIQDKKRNLIGNELSAMANRNENVSFFLTPDYTDLLKVPSGKPYEIYTYGIKVCNDSQNTEDTLFVAGNTYGDENLVIVYPRKVIGG